MAALAMLTACAIASGAAAEARWKPIFDGRSLKGWTPKIVGHPAGDNFQDTFIVKDGAIVCKSGKGALGSEDVRYCTTIHAQADDRATITASEEILLLRMVLPDLTGLEKQQPAALAAE